MRVSFFAKRMVCVSATTAHYFLAVWILKEIERAVSAKSDFTPSMSKDARICENHS